MLYVLIALINNNCTQTAILINENTTINSSEFSKPTSIRFVLMIHTCIKLASCTNNSYFEKSCRKYLSE